MINNNIDIIDFYKHRDVISIYIQKCRYQSKYFQFIFNVKMLYTMI